MCRRIPGQQEGCSGTAVNFGLHHWGSDCCSGAWGSCFPLLAGKSESCFLPQLYLSRWFVPGCLGSRCCTFGILLCSKAKGGGRSWGGFGVWIMDYCTAGCAWWARGEAQFEASVAHSHAKEGPIFLLLCIIRYTSLPLVCFSLIPTCNPSVCSLRCSLMWVLFKSGRSWHQWFEEPNKRFLITVISLADFPAASRRARVWNSQH